MRRVLVLGFAVMRWALSPGRNVGEAYRPPTMIDSGPRKVLVPTATDARRWSEEKWPPGGELVFYVANDPDWSVRFDSPEQEVPYVEKALTVWSAIEGTDIR